MSRIAGVAGPHADQGRSEPANTIRQHDRRRSGTRPQTGASGPPAQQHRIRAQCQTNQNGNGNAGSCRLLRAGRFACAAVEDRWTRQSIASGSPASTVVDQAAEPVPDGSYATVRRGARGFDQAQDDQAPLRSQYSAASDQAGALPPRRPQKASPSMSSTATIPPRRGGDQTRAAGPEAQTGAPAVRSSLRPPESRATHAPQPHRPTSSRSRVPKGR